MNDIKVKIGKRLYKPHSISNTLATVYEPTKLDIEVYLSDFSEEEEVYIKDVIFNHPATIVFWSDGTKTVVKCNDGNFDEEKGLAMAISKKFLGNKGDYYNTFKKHTSKKPYTKVIKGTRYFFCECHENLGDEESLNAKKNRSEKCPICNVYIDWSDINGKANK